MYTSINDSQLRNLQKAVLDSAEEIIAEENPKLQAEKNNWSYYMTDYFMIYVEYQPDDNRFVFKSGPVFSFPDDKYYPDIDTLEFYIE